MANVVEHSTFTSYEEENLKIINKPDPSDSGVDSVMQDTRDEKMFFCGATPTRGPEASHACYGSQADIVKPDHLAPTEETSKKLQLSLDELIQQKDLKSSPFSRQTRRQDSKQHRGGRPFTERSEGSLNSIQKRRLGRRPCPPSHSANDNHRKLFLTRPHSSPYGGVLSMEPLQPFPMGYSPSFYPRNAPIPCAPLPNRLLHYTRSFSNFPHYKMMPSPQQVTMALTPATPFKPLGAQIQRSNADALSLAKDSALSEVEILFPPLNEEGTGPSSCNALVVKFKNTEVLIVRKHKGDMILSSGGWRTLSTQLVLNNALKPLGLWIESRPLGNSNTTGEGYKSPETTQAIEEGGQDNSTSWEVEKQNDSAIVRQRPAQQWTVVDGKFYLAKFEDGMVVGQIGPSSRSQLLARASVVAQHLKQVKQNAMLRRQRHMARTGGLH